jgi:uncharacterized protein
VDWFGGEPLLVPHVVEDLSRRLIAVSERYGARYEASMATNGTRFNHRTISLLSLAKIRDLQITLDGPRDIHDARRMRSRGGPTFEAIVAGVAQLPDTISVSIRINVDRSTVHHSYQLLEDLDHRGLLSQQRNIFPYLALTAPLDAKCFHMTTRMLSFDEFFTHVLAFQRELASRLPWIPLERIFGLPKPAYRGCGARSPWSLVLHPSGLVFKCGLEVHTQAEAGYSIDGNYTQHPKYRKWVDDQPFSINECQKCVYLPLCMGGCPKYNFGEVETLQRESCNYFQRFLSPTLVEYAKLSRERNRTTGPAKVERM